MATKDGVDEQQVPLLQDQDIPEDGDLEEGEKPRGGCCSCCPSSLHARTHSLSDLTYQAAGLTHQAAEHLKQKQVLKVSKSGKVYEYDHEALLSWRALFALSGSIFLNRKVWTVLPYVCAVALVSATCVYYGVPNAQRLNTAKFKDFVTYIKIFIAFMLGLFLNNSFKRWWASVSSFKRFLTSIKQLMYTLHAVQLRKELVEEIERLCVASCYILNHEVHTAQMTEQKHRDRRWKAGMDWLEEHKYLTTAERKELNQDYDEEVTQDLGIRSTAVWTWIGEMMTQVKNEKNDQGAPQVPPPMHVRLLFLCHDCMAQVEELKTNLTVQLPFTYAHMLAVLVHIANILLAVSCGLSLGSSMAETMHRRSQMRDMATIPTEMLKEFYEAVQTSFMQVVMVLIQPLLYQSFLTISHSLCYPYGDEICHMPTEIFIQQMEFELQIMRDSKGSHRKRSEMEATFRPIAKKKQKDDGDDEDDDDDGD